ncbi:MAG: SCP2 sterol-binding domain-containing protein [Acidiferrobacterales bacterium]|jgi:ubiquinone biosynthesis protein UbiJ|nr:SCP2 sterol-binding domain-containing protein [Acidiferrobacterales bacterium]
MEIAHAFTAILEDGCNRLLRLDTDTLRNLGDLDGRVFCLRINNEGKGEQGPRMYFFPSEGGFQIRPEHEGKVDVTITGNPPAFLKLVMGEFAPTLTGSGQMQITGDLELGQQFQKVLKNIDIDWEEHLSGYVGDAVAHRVGYAMRRVRGWTKHVAQTLREDFSEVMIEELQVAAHPSAVQDFMDRVDRLRADVDRLEKRIQKFKDSPR